MRQHPVALHLIALAALAALACAPPSRPDGVNFYGFDMESGADGAPTDGNRPAGVAPTVSFSPQGLKVRIWRRGQKPATGRPPSLADVAAELADARTTAPDATFLDPAIAALGGSLALTGGDTTPLPIFMGSFAANLAVDNGPLASTVVDWSGFIYVSQPGAYTFALTADDAGVIFLDGDGTLGSGTAIARANYQKTLAGDGPNPVIFQEAGYRPIEIFYYNYTLSNAAGGAALAFAVTGPAPVTFVSSLTLADQPPAPLVPGPLSLPGDVEIDLPAVPAAGMPAAWLGPAERVPIPGGLRAIDSEAFNLANAVASPYLPSLDGKAMLTFWVDGANYRSVGPSLTLMPTPSPRAPVLGPGASGAFDGGGASLVNALRRPGDPSVLVGLYRAQNHVFAGGGVGAWDSAGIALSRDEGASWTKLGQIVGTPAPNQGGTAASPVSGGREVTCMLWDDPTARWLGVGRGIGFASQDPNASPGTWFAWDGQAFSLAEPDTANSHSPATLPGLPADIVACKLHRNTYLDRYVMVFGTSGDSSLHAALSADGVNWGSATTLLTSSPGSTLGCAQIIGISDVVHGQEATLFYGESPSTVGRARDMWIRHLHFGL